MALLEIELDDIEDLFHKVSNPRLPKKITIKDGYLTSRREYQAMATLCNIVAPKKIFEIGTFQGYSSLILAMNAPKARIYTLDLPKGGPKTRFSLGRSNAAYVGYAGRLAFEGTKYAPKITCLHGDSASFDFSPFKEDIDFVFVDGAHTYQYTKNDTRKALSILKEDGVIVWHDYNPYYWLGTVRSLDELAKKRELYHIKGTYLVFMKDKK